MSKWWKDIDWRCIQMNFREIDMLDVKVDKIIESLKDFNATVFMINTGGIIASYDTKLPFQHQSEYLKSDSLKEIIDACHRENIRVIARMDFSKIREDIFKLHPEWAFRSPTNDVVNYNGNISACMSGGYQQEAIFDILGEVIDTLHVDGFYFNMPGLRVFDYDLNFYGNCHCDACKTKFKKRFGLDIPEFKGVELPISITSKKLMMAGRTPEMFKYAQFQNEEETKLTQKLRSFIHEKDENCAIMNVDFKRSESNTELNRSLPRLPFHASMKTRLNLGVDQHIISSNTSVDFVGFSFRHVSVSPALQSLRLWQALANFGGLDYYLIGRIDNHQDKTAFDAIKAVYRFRAKHEAMYKNLINQAKVLLVHNSHIHKTSHEENGWIMALTDNHIPFAEAHHSMLVEANLSKYDVIISTGHMTHETMSKLALFTQNGGTLLVTGKLDDNDIMRKLVGVKEHVTYDKDMRSCMFVINDNERSLFPHLSKTEVVFFGTTYDKHTYKKDVKQVLNVSLPQRFGPPEMTYGSGVSEYPGICINEVEKGKTFYIPAEVGQAYFKEGWDNSGLFMTDVLTQLLGLTNLAPKLTKMAEVTRGYNQETHMDVIQIVNTSGFYGTQVHQPIPIHDITLRIPVKEDIDAIYQVVNDKYLPFKLEDGCAITTIDCVDSYEVVTIKYK